MTPARDPSHAEFLDSGLGWLRGCVLLPHARRRLRTDDPVGWPSWRSAPRRRVRDPRRRGAPRPRIRRRPPAGRAGVVDRRRGEIAVTAARDQPAAGAQAGRRRRRPVPRPRTRCRSSRATGARSCGVGRPTPCTSCSGSSGCRTGSPLRRLWGTDLWYVVLELPAGSRIDYQLEVRHGEHVERTNDPLNPKVSHSPVGTSSVCFAHGYHTPDWTLPDPDARPGELIELVVRSRALRRDSPVDALPAGAVPPRRDLPAAGRARRQRLPAVRRGEDGAGQPDPPARRGRDRRRLRGPARPAGRVRELGRARPIRHAGARAPPGGRAAAGRAGRPAAACSARASARSRPCAPRTGRRTPTARSC